MPQSRRAASDSKIPGCAAAGLWGVWTGPAGEPVTSFTILTTEPSDTVRQFHDRMPVILGERDYDAWLSGKDPRDLLRPAHNELLFVYPVSPKVSSVRNNDPSLIEPIEEADRRYLEEQIDSQLT